MKMDKITHAFTSAGIDMNTVNPLVFVSEIMIDETRALAVYVNGLANTWVFTLPSKMDCADAAQAARDVLDWDTANMLNDACGEEYGPPSPALVGRVMSLAQHMDPCPLRTLLNDLTYEMARGWQSRTRSGTNG